MINNYKYYLCIFHIYIFYNLSDLLIKKIWFLNDTLHIHPFYLGIQIFSHIFITMSSRKLTLNPI